MTGGGTGGHIIPHAPIVAELKSLSSEKLEFLYIGSSSGLEETFCREHGIKFKAVATGKLRRYFSIQNFLDWFKLPVGIFQSLKIIKKFNPDVIFSKGGYVAVPPVIAGAFLKKKIVIHESDYTPGLATRLTARFARGICVPTRKTGELLKKKVHTTGNPVRKEILEGNRSLAEKFLKTKVSSPVILVMGGSTGALKLNELIWSSLPLLTKHFTVIHATGKGKTYKKIKDKKYFQFEYLKDELKDIYSIADLIICRSGAGAVSEVNALGLPAVYVPLSGKSSRGDQWENAEHVSSTPHIILDDSALTPEEFFEKVNLFYKKNKGKKIPDKKALDAVKNIAKVILEA